MAVVGLLGLVGWFVAPVAAHAGTLEVVPIGHGSVTYTPAAASAVGADPGLCSTTATTGARNDLRGACTLTYAAGTVVTLRATGGPTDGSGPATAFRRWSDDRCPAGAVCQLTVGAEPRSIAALFSPQRVTVLHTGTGSVTSSPAGLQGTLDPPGCDDSDGQCTGDFDPDLPAPVTLQASAGAAWSAGVPRRPVLCDSVSGTACSVVPAWPRWVSVGFGGVLPDDGFPSEVTVNFRVAKAGDGSGTVRSGALNCGNRCSIVTAFGDSETLTAVPDGGSRFAGWRAACGSDPTCRLAVGPVTSLTAVFRKGPAGTSTAGRRPRPRRRAVAARILGLTVRGHGRQRTISLRLRVNAPATVRARLLRGRRPVASHRWRVRTGTHVLRLRVPARAGPGAYRLRLAVGGGGKTVRITRSVRLRG